MCNLKIKNASVFSDETEFYEIQMKTSRTAKIVNFKLKKKEFVNLEVISETVAVYEKKMNLLVHTSDKR